MIACNIQLYVSVIQYASVVQSNDVSSNGRLGTPYIQQVVHRKLIVTKAQVNIEGREHTAVLIGGSRSTSMSKTKCCVMPWDL